MPTHRPEAEALEAQFRERAEETRDLNGDGIVAERTRIEEAALNAIKSSAIAPGKESSLAAAFADVITAYRSETPDKYLEYFEKRGIVLDETAKTRIQRAWSKTTIMTAGRKVDTNSIKATVIQKNVSNSATDPANNKFVQWITPEKSKLRDVDITAQTQVNCLSIDVLKHENGSGGAYSLTVGFVSRVGDGGWVPAMNLLSNATDRPVAHPPL